VLSRTGRVTFACAVGCLSVTRWSAGSSRGMAECVCRVSKRRWSRLAVAARGPAANAAQEGALPGRLRAGLSVKTLTKALKPWKNCLKTRRAVVVSATEHSPYISTLRLAALNGVQEVAGSNPVAPTFGRPVTATSCGWPSFPFWDSFRPQGQSCGQRFDRSVSPDTLPRPLDSWLLPSSQRYGRAGSTPSLCEHQARTLGHK
jgi:hypothetical protein